MAHGEVKVQQQPLGPDGESLGCSISPRGNHVALFAAKGSRYVVYLDGVEGPRIEALLTSAGGSGSFMTPSAWGGKVPVIFSDDGAHSAYMGKVGNDFIVVVDGKEVSRAPMSSSFDLLPPTFTAGAKHFLYGVGDGQGFQIVADGKTGPALHQTPKVVFSPDGAHYAYVSNADPKARWAVVDGRQVNWFGDSLEYTGRNALLSKIATDDAVTLVLNGKPEIKAARLEPMWMSRDGIEIAIVITPKPGEPSFLTVNGKIIPETKGLTVENVYFSPNGKRWAALCVTKTSSRFMIVDGKKQDDYTAITAASVVANANHWRFVTGKAAEPDPLTDGGVPGFTADSSKFVYVASSGGGRQFLIIEGEESNAYQGMLALQPVLSDTGNHVAVVGVAANGNQQVFVDGKTTDYGPYMSGGRIDRLGFSPSGAHYAFVQNNGTLLVDGVIQPGAINGEFAFSPDDKHIGYQATASGHTCYVMDGKIICDINAVVQRAFFSPDNQHFFLLTRSNVPFRQDGLTLYVDGKPVTHFLDSGVGSMTDFSFEFAAGNVLTFIARTEEKLRRFVITPSADANVSAMLAAAPAAK
ncbi:MAG TPA: hypothetical protein VH370_24195 [Humisphaera sp.]|nr:hypothetical protein [Humisphaera sp.]